MILQAAEWEEWYCNPCTQAFMLQLEAKVQELAEAWSHGAYTDDSGDTELRLNAKALGEIRGIRHAIGEILDCRPAAENEREEGWSDDD